MFHDFSHGRYIADEGGRRLRFVNGIQKRSQWVAYMEHAQHSLGQGKACWSIIGSNLVKGFRGTLQDQELSNDFFEKFVHDVGMLGEVGQDG